MHINRECWNDVNDKPSKKKREEKEWGACKASVLDRRKQEAKQKNSKATERGATRGLPRGHPSQYYSRQNTHNCRVLMGSSALVLV